MKRPYNKEDYSNSFQIMMSKAMGSLNKIKYRKQTV